MQPVLVILAAPWCLSWAGVSLTALAAMASRRVRRRVVVAMLGEDAGTPIPAAYPARRIGETPRA